MKVVIVEDEHIAIRILLVMLEKFDFIELILHAENVDDAVNLITDVKPDLVFLDLGLGAEHGFNVIRRLPPGSVNKIHFCVTSADTRVKTAEAAKKLGVKGFVKKPFTFDDISEAIFQIEGRS
jgi:two-component system LytT family response regulator